MILRILCLQLTLVWGSLGHAAYERVVSTSPAITEIIYALGVQDRLVGVSRFCTFPKGTEKVEKTGTSFDLNIEKLVKLKADYVFLGKTKNQKSIDNLNKLKIKSDVIKQDTLEDIFNSISHVGKVTGRVEQSGHMIEQIKLKLRYFKRHSLDLKKKVLIVIGHQKGSNGFKEFFVMGKKTFYQDILENLKLHNAYEGSNEHPILSNEDLLRLKADVIIDIVPPSSNVDEVKKTWQAHYPKFKNKVHVMANDYALIPGPRIVNIVEDIHRIINK